MCACSPVRVSVCVSVDVLLSVCVCVSVPACVSADSVFVYVCVWRQNTEAAETRVDIIVVS